MFSATALLISTSILFYVLRYRVHIHVTYTTTKRRCSNRTAQRRDDPNTGGNLAARRGSASRSAVEIGTRERKPNPQSGSRPDAQNDLTSALRNLGCSPGIAKQAAQRAAAESKDFDTSLRLAMKYATEKAA